jgi:hypothetical protein
MHTGVVRRPEGKKPHRRPRRRWEGNVKWMFKIQDEWAWTGLMWPGKWLALVNTIMSLRVP